MCVQILIETEVQVLMKQVAALIRRTNSALL